jgi:hypothetical protein
MKGAATVVTYSVSDENSDQLHNLVETMLIPAARDAHGYRGFLLLNQGEGKRLAVVLCDSIESARALQNVLGPIASDHIYPLMTSPSIGTLSTVVLSDGVCSLT